jgi:RNA-binding protein
MRNTSLSPAARRHLRALAHPLHPVVQVGAEGLSEGLCRAVSAALDDHELVKVKLGRGVSSPREPAANELARATDAHLVQVIGRVVVLYRRRVRDDATRPRIELPE